MTHNLLLTTEIDILILLLVACFAAIALKRLQFPYTIGLVVVGLILGGVGQHVPALEIVQALSLSHDLILFVFVPPLIFESALNLDSRLLLRNLGPTLILAAPGLLISTAIVGSLLSWGTSLTLPQALLFGSLISATDPVAVIALFKELGAPKQLAVLVEGESLFNDVTAIVFFNIILATIATEVGFERAMIAAGIVQFLISFIGGVFVGAILGYSSRYLMALVKENVLVLATVTTVLAYGVFLLAEEVFEVSGVIAIVSAGLMAGWYKSNRLKPEPRAFLGEFWEYAAFLANSLIFLLVGLTISQFQLFGQLRQTESLLTAFGLTIGAIVLARAVVIFGLIPLVNLTSESKIDRRYQFVSFWGGLRGAVCLALALSLDSDFPNRDLIVTLTLGIALFTLLIPGTTIGGLIRTFKLDRPPIIDQWCQAIAKVAVKRAVLKQTHLVESFQPRFNEVINEFQQCYQNELHEAERSLAHLREQIDLNEENIQQLVWLTALAIEQKNYRTLYDQGFMSEPVLGQFNARSILLQDAVLSGSIPSQPATFKPVDTFWGHSIQNIVERLAPKSSWLMRMRSQLIMSQYEYWGILAQTSQQVPLQLQKFAEEGGPTFLLAIQPCINIFEQERIDATLKCDQISEQFRETTISCQIKISNRVAHFFQDKTIKQLVAKGIINEETVERIQS